jgi:hypothetical protein
MIYIPLIFLRDSAEFLRTKKIFLFNIFHFFILLGHDPKRLSAPLFQLIL